MELGSCFENLGSAVVGLLIHDCQNSLTLYVLSMETHCSLLDSCSRIGNTSEEVLGRV